LKGRGCPICGGTKKSTKEDFITKAKEIHGDKYDYSKVDYKNNKTEVCIICPIHGEFYQTPKNHLSGRGCPKCSGNKKYTKEDFVQESSKVHGYKYDYSKVVYKNNKTDVCIICPIHGEFYQAPKNHLSGQGCPICANGFNKEYKLSLIKRDDLIHLSQHQLIELISNKNIPNEFKTLAYTRPDSDARLGAIKDLIDLYSNSKKTDEEIEKEILEIIQNKENNLSSNSLNDDSYDNNEQSLPLMFINNIHTYDTLLHLKPSCDAAKFIILESIHKIWNEVLTANEEDKLNYAIEKIKNEDGGEFWKHIQSKFLNEFHEVIAIEKDEDYKFPYDRHRK
jgi:hypothetical protein